MVRLSKLFLHRPAKTFNPERQPEPLKQTTWVSDSLLVQVLGDSLSDAIAKSPAPQRDYTPPNIVHLVNLYPAQEGNFVQGNTIDSMRRAAQTKRANVRLVNVQAQGDTDQTPEGFERAPDLTRSILDIKPLTPARPLPLLFDILENGAALAEDSDYLIFTNADICLQPYFYDALSEMIARGYDSLVINRRTVGAQFVETPDSPLLAAETGKTHPGFDCLVFRKSTYNQFIRNDACVGMRGVALPLLHNMIAFSEQIVILRNVSLTYHFGDDVAWQDEKFSSYGEHNIQEYLNNLRNLLARPGPAEKLVRYFGSCYCPPACRLVLHEMIGDRVSR